MATLPTVTDWRNKLNPLLEARKTALRKVKEEKENLERAKQRLENVQKAQSIVQEVSQTIQNEAHQKIARVVSRCLRLVFDDPYSFHIHFEKKRGRTEARLSFFRGNLEVSPLGATGGGVIDVASFALRLASLILSLPPKRRLLVLDEPFARLSVEYRPQVAEMLEVIAEDLEVQIVMVTHSSELEIGKIVRINPQS